MTTSALLIGLLLVAITAFGVGLRLEDPLSSPVIGAEDPYSHIVFTREALDRGWFGDSLYLGTTMYPPGLHAFMGAVAPLSGIGLYEFTRFAPVAFGALAIVGTFVLARRLVTGAPEEADDKARALGSAAGLSAAFFVAIMPEHVFRTNLMFPTALDLALLPAWMLAFWHAARPGPHAVRVPYAALFAVMTPPLAIMHPWLVPLFAVPLALFVALRALRAAAHERDEATHGRPRRVARALALPAALLAAAVAFAMAFRWDESDTGFADFLSQLPLLAPLGGLDVPGPLLFLILLALMGVAAAAGIAAVAALSTVRMSLRARRVASGVVGAALLMPVPFLLADLPAGVDYSDMLGVVPVLFALGGFLLAFLRPSALGDLGIAIVLWLFPFTAINVFESEFWPARTVVYLSVGVALLAASAVVRLAEVLSTRMPVSGRAALPAGVMAALLLSAGAAAALPAERYDWYRLYSDEEFEALEETVALVADDEDARVFVHGWQPAVVLRGMGAGLDQPWYAPKLFDVPEKREEYIGKTNGPAYVLVDRYLTEAVEEGEADLSFLDEGGYELVLVSDDGRLKLYHVEGTQ